MAEFIAAKSGETEQQWRQFLAYLFTQVSTGKAATGVLAGLGVTQTTTASGSILVGSGAAVVQAATNDGASPLVNPSQKTVDVFTTNPVSSLPRYDMVVFDAATADIHVIVGTPSATPTDPTVPSSAVKLARLRQIQSGQPNYGTIPASIIDDLRQPTAAFGSRVVVSSAAQRDALVKSVGLKVYRTDKTREETWDGTGWLTEAFGMDQSVTTNANGEWNFDTGLSSILYFNAYNGNGGLVRSGFRNNITIARNSSGASYFGGVATGIIFAAETKAAVGNTTVRIDWIAKGYA